MIAPAGAERRSRLIRVAAVMGCTLLVLAGAFLFTLRSNADASSVTSAVHDAYAKHLADFATENATLLSGDYAPGATVTWTGDTRNWGGEYVGSEAIGSFYSGFFSVYVTDSFENAVYSVQPAGGRATVNGSMLLVGLGITNQSIRATIVSSAVYQRVNGAWVIESETWAFQTFFILQPLF